MGGRVLTAGATGPPGVSRRDQGRGGVSERVRVQAVGPTGTATGNLAFPS
jgi:hypothetical protein